MTRFQPARRRSENKALTQNLRQIPHRILAAMRVARSPIVAWHLGVKLRDFSRRWAFWLGTEAGPGLYKSARPMDVPIPCHRQRRWHGGVLLQPAPILANTEICQHRDLRAAKRFLRKVLARHGRPHLIVIDGSQTNHEAIGTCYAELSLRDLSQLALKPIEIPTSQDLNNRVEQHHRGVKRRIRSVLGFKAMGSAKVRLCGIEMVHTMGKQQARFAYSRRPSLKAQFELLAARGGANTSFHKSRLGLRQNRPCRCSCGPQRGKPSLRRIEISGCQSIRL